MSRAVKHFRSWSFRSDAKSKYQVGPMFRFRAGLLEKYYLNNIYRHYINEDNYNEYYCYHLSYFKEQNPDKEEKDHFKYVLGIVQARIQSLQMTLTNRTIREREKLESYLEYLQSIDQWGFSIDKHKQSQTWELYFNEVLSNQKNINHRNETIEKHLKGERNLDAFLNEFEKLIHEKNQLAETIKQKDIIIEEQAKKLTKSQVNHDNKIAVDEEHLDVLYHLLLTIRDLKLPNTNNKLITTHSKTTWVKMIFNNFKVHGEDLKYGTIENYFIKDHPIKSKKLYNILTIK